MKSLMKDESLLDDSDNLYRVFILTVQTYTKSLLNDENAPDDRSYSLYRILTLTARPIRSYS